MGPGVYKKYNPRDAAPYVIRWKTLPAVWHQTPKLGGHAFDWWRRSIICRVFPSFILNRQRTIFRVGALFFCFVFVFILAITYWVLVTKVKTLFLELMYGTDMEAVVL